MIIQNAPIRTITSFKSSRDKSEPKSSDIKTRSNNAIMGALLALASLTPISASAGVDRGSDRVNPVTIVQDEDEIDMPEDLKVEFSDDNGILEQTDFKYSSKEAEKKAKGYLDGLKPYMGKSCTQAVSDMANNLVHVFNMSNSYAFDMNTDEMVKNAESSIVYDRFGRVLATKLKYSADSEDVVTYKYYPNGSIDAAIYKGDKVIEYRKNGTRFSLVSDDPLRSKEIIRYNHKGNPIYRSVTSPNTSTEYTFDGNGQIIKHFYKDNTAGYQKVYNDGELLLTTLYDSKGRVKKYTDNYFEKKGDDFVVSGYLSSKVVHRGEPYNVLYKQAPLDGKITQPIRQGTTGTCYAAGIVNSCVRIQAGRELLDRALPSDFDTSKCIVDFKGLNKRYSISADAISHNMSRLGRKDADYSGMIMAFEKFRESGELFDENTKLPEFFYIDHRGEDDRRVDSGTPLEFFYALTGKIMNHSDSKITDADIQKARQCLATGRGIVNVGTVKDENKKDEIPIGDKANGIVPKHVLSVISIGANDVTLYDSVTEKEFSYPINKLKKYCSALYWATVD